MTIIFNRHRFKSLRQKLRKARIPAEELLWNRIRHRRVRGVKFRRQYGVGRYVLDFYAPSIRLAVEIDGPSHSKPGARERDRIRQEYIEGFGIHFLRFTNDDIYRALDRAVAEIERRVDELSRAPAPSRSRSPMSP